MPSISAQTDLRKSRAMGGFALPMVLIFTLLITLLGWGVLTLAAHEGELLLMDQRSRQALYTAEAGLQRTLSRFAVSGTWGELAGTLYEDEPFANGSYTVTVTYDQPMAGMVSIQSDGTFRGRTRRVVADISRGL